MRALAAWIGLLSAGGAVGIVAACSGSDAGNGAGDDAGADVETPQSDAAAKDSGPDIEQDPNVYPAEHAPIPQLDYLGGPILDHIKLVTVTFKTRVSGNQDSGLSGDADIDASPDGSDSFTSDPLRNAVTQFDDFIVTSDWWHKTVGEYKISEGKSAGHVELEYTERFHSLSNDDLQRYIQEAISAGDLPIPDPQTLYVLYFPAGATISAGNALSCQSFYGYHSSAQITTGSATSYAPYAVVPRCQMDSPLHTLEHLTMTASHEIAEAATDPLFDRQPAYEMMTNDAWIPGAPSQPTDPENGDLCVQAPPYDESGFTVQSIYSNTAAALSKNPCQPTNGIRVYFNAAVRTVLQDVGNGAARHRSAGYIRLKRGSTQDTIINVFSEAPLPHDVSLYVGAKPAWYDPAPADPTALPPVPNSIHVELDGTTAHNGNAVRMTVSAPSTAAPGDFGFVVRSVLEPNDFHDWPVIVEIIP